MKPSLHNLLWWLLLIPLLVANLIAGFFMVLCRPESFGALFAIGAFSFAYALHILSASAALCGRQMAIRANEQQKFEALRALEYRIVTYGMCALAGGLSIFLAASLCAFENRFAIYVFGLGVVLQLIGVLGYVLFDRRWADKARAILNGTTDPVATPSLHL